MRRKNQLLHPNSAGIISEDDTDDETEDEAYNQLLPVEELSFVRLKRKLKRIRDSAEEKLTISDVLVENIIEPRFNLDVTSMEVVKTRIELLKNLNLVMRGNFLFVTKDKSFSEELLYDEGQLDDFRECVIKHGGYFLQEENYFNVDSKLLSEMSKATMLINSRVLLFWRGITLDDLTVKRILTAGLGFLIGSISYAELILTIRKEVPKGTFEISVKYQKDAYVLIGMEEPLFQH